MSIPVELPSLANVITRYRFAYLMTITAKGAPHAVVVNASMQDGDLVVSGLGRRSRENVLARPTVGLVWPPETEGDYSLFVDGQAVVSGDSLRVTPTRAVLHRPAPSPEPNKPGCGSDCVELQLSV